MTKYLTGKRKLALAIGIALSASAGILPAGAAVMTSPLVITDKNQVINDDFNVKENGSNFSVIKAGNDVSNGTISINSRAVETSDRKVNEDSINSIIRTEGTDIEGSFGQLLDMRKGYEGTINLADGMKISGNTYGDSSTFAGIYEEGYKNLQTVYGYVVDDNGRRRWEHLSDNTGKPADVTINLGKNTTISVSGESAAVSQNLESRQYSDFAVMNSGGHLNVGDGSVLSAETKGRFALMTAGIYTSKYGENNLGNNVSVTGKGTLTGRTSGEGAEVYGLFGDHAYFYYETGNSDDAIYGNQKITAGNNLTVTADLSCNDINYDDPYSLMDAAVRLNHTDLKTGENTLLHALQENKGLGTYAMYITADSSADFGNNFNANVETNGKTYGTFGLYGYGDGVKITLEGKATTTMKAQDTHQFLGNALYGSTMTLKGPYAVNMTENGENTETMGMFLKDGGKLDASQGKLSVNININGDSVKDPGYYNRASTQFISDTAHISGLENDAGSTSTLSSAEFAINFKGNMTEKSEFRGMGNNGEDSTITAKGPVNVILNAENAGTKADTQVVFGLSNDAGNVKISGPFNAQISSRNTGGSAGVYTTDGGQTELGDGSMITMSSDSDIQAGVLSEEGGTVTFDGGATLSGAETALYSTGDGSAINLDSKGTKVVTGDLYSSDGGIISMTMEDRNSILTGKSTVENGTTDLAVSDGSLWNMTGDSTITNLTLESGAKINMTANKNYQTLHADTFDGEGGNLYMKTDLDSETDGDKMTITKASEGSSAQVQVDDTSLYTGKEVTGVKNLLLITDESNNAVFTGKDLDKGGLWDVTPTIERGDKVKDAAGNIVGKDTEWYLTKVQKKVNKDTRPVIDGLDNNYALYRHSIDTLRERLGDLRFHKAEDDSGIWARNTYGAYSGSGIYSKENRFQLGYDHWANRKSVYGILAERGIASPRYSHGSGKDHTLAGALYGTWFGDGGSYTDVVAKVGRDDTTINTYGNYPDKADYRSRGESLSIEYGRTHNLNDKGLFLEPQAQLVLGHLNHVNYTTERGKTVHMDSYNSAIGRLGFVLGDRKPEATRPFDYYIKASVLHEFGGDRDFYLTAPDGETMDREGHYRDTWYEVGLGGTFRVKPDVYIYGDADREFGGKWNEKWRVNMGIHFTF